MSELIVRMIVVSSCMVDLLELFVLVRFLNPEGAGSGPGLDVVV